MRQLRSQIAGQVLDHVVMIYWTRRLLRRHQLAILNTAAAAAHGRRRGRGPGRRRTAVDEIDHRDHRRRPARHRAARRRRGRPRRRRPRRRELLQRRCRAISARRSERQRILHRRARAGLDDRFRRTGAASRRLPGLAGRRPQRHRAPVDGDRFARLLRAQAPPAAIIASIARSASWSVSAASPIVCAFT